jgi:hypothetical protein
MFPDEMHCKNLLFYKKGHMIIHSVIFNLRHKAGSAAFRRFILAALELRTIKGVDNFEILKQTSNKNRFQFGISMNFNSQVDYEFYNNHPMHVQFINEHWIPSVEEFMEIDYEQLSLDGVPLT